MAHSKEVKDGFRKRLGNIISTKIRTTMVYPLSQFEMAFGELWGHGKDELTEQEKIYKAKWEECRNNILNNGNRQIRNTITELDMHDVVWNRYKTILLPMKEKINV